MQRLADYVSNKFLRGMGMTVFLAGEKQVSLKPAVSKDGEKTVRCLSCNSSVLTKTAPALFVCKGYSSPVNGGNQLSIGFDINPVILTLSSV